MQGKTLERVILCFETPHGSPRLSYELAYVGFSRVKKLEHVYALPVSATFKKRALGELRPAINAVKWHMDVDGSGFHVKRKNAVVNEEQAVEGKERYYAKGQEQKLLSSRNVREGNKAASSRKVREESKATLKTFGKRKSLSVSDVLENRKSTRQRRVPEPRAFERITHWQFDENDFVIESQVKQCVGSTDGVTKQHMMELVDHSPRGMETEAYVDSDVIGAYIRLLRSLNTRGVEFLSSYALTYASPSCDASEREVHLLPLLTHVNAESVERVYFPLCI